MSHPPSSRFLTLAIPHRRIQNVVLDPRRPPPPSRRRILSNMLQRLLFLDPRRDRIHVGKHPVHRPGHAALWEHLGG